MSEKSEEILREIEVSVSLMRQTLGVMYFVNAALLGLILWRVW